MHWLNTWFQQAFDPVIRWLQLVWENYSNIVRQQEATAEANGGR